MGLKSGSSKRRGRSVGSKNVNKVDSVGKCKVGRKTKKQFRGTLKRCFTFFNGLELREVHIAGLKQTPFYNFVVPFTKGKFTADSVSSMQAGVVQLIKTYSPSGGGFNIGGRMLKMESSEFELIFGITSGDVKVDRTPANIGESSLAQRKFSEFKTIRPRNLKEVLEKHLSSDSAEDVADTVRIVVINLLSSVLYATCAEQVSLWMFRICEDLDKLHEYNWGQSVVSYFMESVKESSADAVRGSTLLFMYWICERVKIFKPQREDVFPRFRKWNLQEMRDVLKKTEIKDIKASQVRERPIKATAVERSILSGDDYSTETEGSEGGTDREYDMEGDEVEGLEGKNEECELPDKDQRQQTETDMQCVGNVDLSVADKASMKQPCTTAKQSSLLKETIMDDENVPISLLIAKYPQISDRIKHLESQVFEMEKEKETMKIECEAWKKKATSWATLNAELHDQISDMDRSVQEGLRKELEIANAKLNVQLEENEKLKNELSRVGIDDADIRVCNEVVVQDSNKKIGTELVPYLKNIGIEGMKYQQPRTEKKYEGHGTMPTFNLLSQPTPTPSPQKCGDNYQGPTWLTQFSQNTLNTIDRTVETVEVQNQRSKENASLQKESGDIERRNLSVNLDASVLDSVQTKSDDEFEAGPSTLERIAQRDPDSVPAKRTRSRKTILTPPAEKTTDVVSKGYKRCNAYLDLSKVAKEVVDMMAIAVGTSGQYQWRSTHEKIILVIPHIFACIQNKSISSTVIDSYAHVLTIDQEAGKFKDTADNGLHGRTLVFPSLLLDSIRQDANKMFEPIPKMYDTSYRYLVFPILNKANSKRRVVDHWTVLVVDRVFSDYQFFNSKRPRKKNAKDPYMEEAKELVEAIERVGRRHNIYLPYGGELFHFEYAPQQDADSVDCGVAVLYVMKQFFLQKMILKNDGETAVRKMRSEIVEELVRYSHNEQYKKNKRMKTCVTRPKQ